MDSLTGHFKKDSHLQQRKESLVKDFQESFQIRHKYPDVIPFHMQSFQQENIYTVPNLLCLGRIGASPFLCYFIITKQFEYTVLLAIVTAFTDWLDGYVARKFPGQASVFGSYLDPLADKISIATLFLSLYYIGLIPGPLTAIVVARDVGLLSATAYSRYVSLEPPRTVYKFFKITRASPQMSPLYISKVNTALQFILVSTILASTVMDFPLDQIINILSWSVAGTTTSSALAYAIEFFKKPKCI
ncbi:unnamed protein product [Allacma fusca]|uniref:cardiolipin synthase (CMP-forming) n=1 Tax=Allacma fusca TaxID=39272 RepID=A0A8J2J6K9_9HEXA|nr:unnamed protein product [Allacma fusca]